MEPIEKRNLEFKHSFKKRTYQFALEIIKCLDRSPKDQVRYIISGQLIRSASSIGANIIEAQACSTRKDYTNYFHHALKSANETKFWLALLKDSKRLNKNKVDSLFQEVDEISRILGKSIKTLKGYS